MAFSIALNGLAFPALQDQPRLNPYVEIILQPSPSGILEFDKAFSGGDDSVGNGFPFPTTPGVLSQTLDLKQPAKAHTLFVRIKDKLLSAPYGFVAWPIRDGDGLALTQSGPRQLIGQLNHLKPPAEKCTVRCADGRSSHDCIRCESDGVIGILCC
jgi:hypothetical protein